MEKPMPFGYAVPVFVVALATLSVVVPPRRSRLHARLSFWAGAVLNELPQLMFYLLLGSTVLTIAEGDIGLRPVRLTSLRGRHRRHRSIHRQRSAGSAPGARR
jgi:hypothetical protein